MKSEKWLKLWAILTQRWFIIALYFIIGVVAPLANYHRGILGMMIVFSSLAPTDLFYGEIGKFYRRKGLRALPCTLFWMLLVAEMMLIKYPGKPVEKLS
jgi:hypothetical protein